MKKRISFILLLVWVVMGLDTHGQTAISTADGLLHIAMNGNYYLTSDLEVDSWVPLGIFTGTLDGRGHVVRIINGESDGAGNMGLFSQTNGATIVNLFIEGRLMYATNVCGGIVAHAVNTTIRNCETSMLMVTNEANAIMGGIIGVMEGGVVENSSCNNCIEGYKIGGIAGTTSNTAAIKNCYANINSIVRNPTNSEVGWLVSENHGTLENNYTKIVDRDWYLPSIGQLNKIYCHKPIFMNTSVLVDFYDGNSLSTTFSQTGYIQCINELGRILSKSVESFSTNDGGIFKLVHDVYGAAYNVGDLVDISGTKAIIFHVNENGYGGTAVACKEEVIRTHFVQLSNSMVSDYYLTGSQVELLNKDYAQCHTGTAVGGATVNTVPEAYRENPGKLFTKLLRSDNYSDNYQVNRLIPSAAGASVYPTVKQLAYSNLGTINHCYYPVATDIFNVVHTGAVTQCGHYSTDKKPYLYGEFGSRLYEGGAIGATRLSDLLNSWVEAQGSDRYSYWTNPATQYINDGNPILKYGFNDGTNVVNTASKVDKYDYYTVLRYRDLNHIPSGLTDIQSEYVYYDQRESMTVDNVTTPWSSPVFLTEEATLKGSFKLKANACVLLDNSDASGFGGANYDWHFVSSPFSNTPIGIRYSPYTNGGPYGNPSQVVFNNESGYFPTNTPYQNWDFYCFYEPQHGWLNFKRKTGDHYNPYTGNQINYTNESTLVPGKGYLWAIGATTSLKGEGTLNNNDVTITLSRQSNQVPGYNLVGNPYMAYLDMDAFFADNGSALEQQAYSVLDADKQGYIYYTLGASANPDNAPRYVHAHQGFFVQAAYHNALLRFKTSQTLVSASSTFREDPVNYPLVNFVLTDDQGRKEYLTIEIDRPQSGGMLKMRGLANCFGELSASHESEEYSILFLPSPVRSVPIHLDVNQDGRFTLQWTPLHAQFDYLHLIDQMSGTDIDCLQENEYVFSASTIDYPSRFKLVFRHPNDLEEQEEETYASDAFATVRGDQLVLRGQGRVELYDLTGRRLRSVELSHPFSSIPIEELAHGIYLLRLTTQGGVQTQKIIIP